MKKSLKERMTLHPIMTILIMVLITIVLSGFLSFLGISSTYNTINEGILDYSPVTISVKSLFSLSGLKYIFTNTVKNFVNFVPLSSLIIILIGIGVMEKSGFLKTAITLLTKKAKKNTVTYFIVLISMIASIVGDLSYVVLIPISALIFLYGKRNPSLGIIASFAGLTCGSGLSILITSIDSSMLSLTALAASVIDKSYSISNFSFLVIMLFAIIILSFVITKITEEHIAKKLPKYEFEESSLEEDISIGKKELRGLVISLGMGIIYLLIFIYNIIPGLPFSGNLLDYSQNFYIDKLFSYNSFFSNGFVFIVTMLFIILGLFYGIGAKTIKNNKDFCEDLGHSLDGVGNIMVLIFFASLFISVFKYTQIGTLIVSALTSILSSFELTAFPAIIVLFIIAALSTIFVPSSLSSWSITSGVAVPVLMNSGISPAFTQVIYRFGECMTLGLTPLFAYFVIYLAFLEKYNQKKKPISLFTTLKYQLPYALAAGAILLILLIIWFIIGAPIGIGAYPKI
ncbi:MAG: AbgT family transporter [Bacilli bacterium]|nr:AbgT family transporter [Bacilli bacterium]